MSEDELRFPSDRRFARAAHRSTVPSVSSYPVLLLAEHRKGVRKGTPSRSKRSFVITFLWICKVHCTLRLAKRGFGIRRCKPKGTVPFQCRRFILVECSSFLSFAIPSVCKGRALQERGQGTGLLVQSSPKEGLGTVHLSFASPTAFHVLQRKKHRKGFAH